ncbi:MAG: hypothetical protein OXE94_04010 [Aestuariivita sp.]|nr:hypothetical protein [Aestuariivita sp.]MCY4201684.1 hypothetical protein [Aestuariivita sp.]
MEIFLHQRAKPPSFVEIDLNVTIADLAGECLTVGAHVWIENGHQPLDPAKTLVEIGITERCHLHVSICNEILVKVRFADTSIDRKFPPPTSTASILNWAVRPDNFNLTVSQVAKHVLVIRDTDTELNLEEHIGFYADDDCSVSLDLVPKERFEG